VQRVAELVVRELLPIEVAREKILVGLHDRLDELLPEAPTRSAFLGEVGDGFLRSCSTWPCRRSMVAFKSWCSPRGTCSGTTRLPYASRSCSSTRSKSAFSRSSRPMTTMRGVSAVSSSDHTSGCDLDARRGVDEDDGGVGNAEPGVLVAGKVGKARRVDEVDLDAVVGEEPAPC